MYALYYNGLEYRDSTGKPVQTTDREALCHEAVRKSKHDHRNGVFSVVRLHDHFIHATAQNGVLKEAVYA